MRLLSRKLTLLLLFWAWPSWATLTVVHTGTTFNNNALTSISAPAINMTSGNLYIVGFWTQSTDIDSSVHVTDTAGNTYTQIGANVTNNVNIGRMFYAINTTGNASNVIKATWSTGSGSYDNIFVWEVSSSVANFTSNPVHANSSDTGLSSFPTGSVLTVGANAIIFATLEADGQGIAGIAGYSTLTDAGSGFEASGSHINISASEGATFSSGSGNWRIKSASFDEPTGGGATGSVSESIIDGGMAGL